MNKENKYITILKKMFSDMVEKKNSELIPVFYHEDFQLFANGHVINYKDFYKDHAEIYKTDIQYKIRYAEETLLEQKQRIAGRIFITIKKQHEPEKEIEVILIAEFKNDKIYRLWELTYPDWSKMETFKDMVK